MFFSARKAITRAHSLPPRSIWRRRQRVWWRSKPPDGPQFTAGRPNPGKRLIQRLCRDRHVKCIGVQQSAGVAHDADVSGPEQKIAADEAPSITHIYGLADRVL